MKIYDHTSAYSFIEDGLQIFPLYSIFYSLSR